jgi:hypothetical protein
MKFSVAAVAALSGVAFAAPVADAPDAATGPDPSTIQIKGIAYNGSGCPKDSVATIMADDRSAFTLLMSDYTASIGDGTKPTDWTKNCQINIDLRYPQGWQYSLFEATYRGTAVLDKGVVGTQSAVYYFTGAGSTQQCKASTTIKGPYSDLYKITDTIGVETLVWSPCGANGKLNINSNVRLSKTGNGSGVLTTESVDGNFRQIYGMQWRRC